MLESSTDLLQQDDNEFRHYKRTINQIFTFDYCLKESPNMQAHFMNQVIQGNVSFLREMIEHSGIQVQDVLQMRSLDFVVPIDIEDQKFSLTDMRVYIDAYNWNPIHYATAYKRYKVLELYKSLFADKIDFLWALQLPYQDNVEGEFQETNRFKEHGLAQFMDEGHAHLYGYVLVLTTKSVDLLNFFIKDLSDHGALNLVDVKFLIKVIKQLQWDEGLMCLIKSTFTKNLFVMSSLRDKIEFVEQMLSMGFVQSFLPVSTDQDY